MYVHTTVHFKRHFTVALCNHFSDRLNAASVHVPLHGIIAHEAMHVQDV